MAIRIIAFLLLLIPLKLFSNPNRPITDEIFYFIVTDRFENSDPTNDRGDFIQTNKVKQDSDQDILKHGYWPSNKGYYHGGDFNGIKSRLPYLKDMGITAIWLSPIQKNRPVQGDGTLEGSSSAYHGYWIEDFTTVDPHLGTEQEFAELVRAAHDLDMKVFMDIITNHTADVIQYRECTACSYRSRNDFPYSTNEINPNFDEANLSYENFENLVSPNYAYTPFLASGDKSIKKPLWLNNIKYYHNRGETTFTGENSLLGDFFGLDDLFTENPRVLDGMIEIQKEWIRKYRIDGFRVDTVRHVNMEFWQKFVPELVQYAQDIGIPDFTMFGEVYDPNPRNLSPFIRQGKFPSLLDFAFQDAVQRLIISNDKDSLKNKLAFDDLYRQGGDPQSMINFISNHDMGRLGRLLADQDDKQAIKKLRLAHALMFFARGVPVIYYGDEQGFTGDGGDKDAREDMFPSLVESYNDNRILGTSKTTAVSNFDQDHILYQSIREFSELYKKHPILRSGEQEFIKHSNQNLQVFSRSFYAAKNEYLVIANLSNEPQNYELPKKSSQVLFSRGSLSNHALKIPSWDFAIVKQPKFRATLQHASFVKPSRNHLSGGGMTLQVDVEGNRWNQVSFSITNLQTGSTKRLPTDYNRPYQAFFSGESFDSGTNLLVEAIIRDQTGKTITLKRKLIIDSRTPTVTVHYENGNKRTEATHRFVGSQLSLSKNIIDGGSYSFEWPTNKGKSFLIYSDPQESGTQIDQIIELDYSQDIEPNLESTPEALKAHIYINNLHEVTSTPHEPSEIKPKSLSSSTEAPPFGEEIIYLKGDMNNWLLDHPLSYKGANSYTTRVNLEAGTTAFKFSDLNWSANLNFGGPFSKNGITRSSSSLNLFIEINEASEYTFDFSYYPLSPEFLIPIIRKSN